RRALAGLLVAQDFAAFIDADRTPPQGANVERRLRLGIEVDRAACMGGQRCPTGEKGCVISAVFLWFTNLVAVDCNGRFISVSTTLFKPSAGLPPSVKGAGCQGHLTGEISKHCNLCSYSPFGGEFWPAWMAPG